MRCDIYYVSGSTLYRGFGGAGCIIQKEKNIFIFQSDLFIYQVNYGPRFKSIQKIIENSNPVINNCLLSAKAKKKKKNSCYWCYEHFNVFNL